MTRLIVAVVLLAVGLAAVSAVGGSSTAALPRATSDRPDDFAGLQVHAIYAVPSDGADRAFDTSGDIESSIQASQSWLAGQASGRTLRLDTFQGSLDVTFHRLARPDAEYAARGLFLRDLLEQDLRAAGLVTPHKLYIVYFDGSNSHACGGSAWPPALPGAVAAFYLRAQVGTAAPCLSTGFAPPGEPPRYTEFAVLHEMLHPVGIVGTCAPHHTRAGHVSESPNDLMYAGDQPWTPSVLDIGHDDYFQAGRADCPDLATSGILSGDVEFPVTVRKVGRGAVVSEPWRTIDCGSRCSARFVRGTVVTLRATVGAFRGWSGACSGRASCTLKIDGPKAVSATFAAPRSCRVPRVVGRALRVARRLVTRAGCRVGRVRATQSSRPRGRVMRQAPRAGTRVRLRTRVHLTISRGR